MPQHRWIAGLKRAIGDLPACLIPALMAIEAFAMATEANPDQVRSFREVRTGDAGRLVLCGAIDATLQRLMAMGLTPGVHVKVLRIAPLGDPIILEVGGVQLSLRRKETEGLGLASAAGSSS